MNSSMSSASSNQACEYCGLPVPQPLWSSRGAELDDAAAPAYCCYGCQVAHAITQEQGEEGSVRWTLTRLGIGIFFAMNVMVFTLALWSYDSGTFDTSTKMAASFSELLRSMCLILSLPVLFLLGIPLVENVVEQLRSRRFSSDLLLLSGILAAYGYSIVAVWTGNGPIYFEVGCMILVLVTLGRWLEATGKLKSTQALDKLQQLLPSVVQRISSVGLEEEIPREHVTIGDQLRVRAGERIPCDGYLVSARTTVDEQLVTGESWPVEKQSGDPLTGGTINLDGDVVLRVSTPPNQGTLNRLVEAVREARNQRGQFQQLADRYARWFLPVVVVIAVGVFAVHTSRSGVMQGTMSALSVILIACPCALGLATPMAIWAAIGTAARRGIVFRTGAALEQLAEVKALRFDKTGTLTTGTPKVEMFWHAPEVLEETSLLYAALLARTSTHIFSRAISEFVTIDPQKSMLTEATSHPGQGVTGQFIGVDGTVALGNLRLMERLQLLVLPEMQQQLQQAQTQGQPYVLIGWEGTVRGLFKFRETLRTNARSVLQECEQRGLQIAILTGDHAKSADRLASQLLNEHDLHIEFFAELTPEQKSQHIRQAQTELGPVALVGDGVNDAPALASADVGIALGCGADVTRESADVCLIADDLTQIPWLMDLSVRTIATIRKNLLWAFGYNSFGILLAATGWLHPAFAAIFMVGSSLYVITNSLRLSSDFAVDDVSIPDPLSQTSESPPCPKRPSEVMA